MLSRELATQMRGRAFSWEMFQYSFREFLDFHGIEGDLPFSAKARYLVQKGFEDFWERHDLHRAGVALPAGFGAGARGMSTHNAPRMLRDSWSLDRDRNGE